MLHLNQINKTYGIQPILKNISFSVNPGDRLGLIGPNGCGKTTLIRIMAGQEKPDSGTILTHPVNLRVGYLPQGFDFQEGLTVGQYLDTLHGGRDLLIKRLEDLAKQLTQEDANPNLQTCYDETLQDLVFMEESPLKAENVLAALGLENIPQNQPARQLSGGQKTRMALAGLLIKAPQLLLLDEPTNHLDIHMLAWLEDWLLSQKGAAVIVSHDRTFLNRTTNEILELETRTHNLKEFTGNYEDYLIQKQTETDRYLQQYQDQQEKIKHSLRTVEKIRKLATPKPGLKTKDNDKFAKGFFNDRKLEVMRRAKHVEKRVESMLNGDRIEKPRKSYSLKMVLEEHPTGGRDALVLKNLSVGYGSLILFKELETTIRFGSRVVLVGDNGSGKTSFLRSLMGELDPLAGSFQFGSQAKPGYMSQEREDSWFKADPFSTISGLTHQNETEVRRFLSFYLFFGDDVFTPISKLSYGERSRLSLACLAANGFNFLLLDEPTNHLDIPSREQFEKALEQFEGTALIVSHDRYFNERFATEIWTIHDQRVSIIKPLNKKPDIHP